MLADGYQVRGAESENIKCKIIRQQQGEAAWGTRAGPNVDPQITQIYADCEGRKRTYLSRLRRENEKASIE